ncbi:Thiol-disulfide isomerase or thioredoxin [Actinacidiphila yanglinensis]|uniref:Thiol-disulfide isomerase or thioredoxin n=1 Tax=Actinacidiphila yanglinensis TaxID=310779 RepID=A0A1H5W478_9ACTN|nr:TlpA disulfide reductase family protein [Actinacidiphila yanglinensis]SEF94292.1 Thiol-disulfide isomerase or thioredoxin [Actinacidiphila yanglinensis]
MIRTRRSEASRPPARTRRARVPRTLLVAAGLAPLLAACGLGGGSHGNGGGVTDDLAPIAVADRVAAPDLTGSTLTGGQESLAAYKGHVVVVNIWSSTCGPCRAEAPGLASVATSTRAQGVRFLGIDTRDGGRANAAAFQKRFALPYPSLFDPFGREVLKFPKGSVNPQSVPATVVIDAQGRIAARALHIVDEADLRHMLRPFLPASASAPSSASSPPAAPSSAPAAPSSAPAGSPSSAAPARTRT